jgi:hypothetical protein
VASRRDKAVGAMEIAALGYLDQRLALALESSRAEEAGVRRVLDNELPTL